MLRGWKLSAKSGGKWPTPLSQDPLFIGLILIVLWFFLCVTLLPTAWELSVFASVIFIIAVAVFCYAVNEILKQNRK